MPPASRVGLALGKVASLDGEIERPGVRLTTPQTKWLEAGSRSCQEGILGQLLTPFSFSLLGLDLDVVKVVEILQLQLLDHLMDLDRVVNMDDPGKLGEHPAR